MQCVPVCTMCHDRNPGSEGTWTSKQLPKALFSTVKMVNGMEVRVLEKRNADSLKEAFAIYAKTADPAVLEKIRTGHEPGTNENVCGPTYGCGAHVAKDGATSRDWSGPLWIIGAVVTSALLRRRGRPSTF
jgi:hypothetical protein